MNIKTNKATVDKTTLSKAATENRAKDPGRQTAEKNTLKTR